MYHGAMCQVAKNRQLFSAMWFHLRGLSIPGIGGGKDHWNGRALLRISLHSEIPFWSAVTCHRAVSAFHGNEDRTVIPIPDIIFLYGR